jgi:hypothetical protein
VAAAFPATQPGDDDTSFTVSMSGPGELSERLGALLGLGAVVSAVEPVVRPLEERVRDALEGGS